jgi:predicted pyridoxine 5'-phosphate oxidase superfamily flavin-nucleotide-binding protein
MTPERAGAGDREGTELDLDAMRGCFDGIVPPVIATCAADGTPNLTHLSQLFPVDPGHIALSNQFFGKTAANLAANPRSSVLVTDSVTYRTYRLELEFERTETSGPLFESMRASVDAIGSLTNMAHVFVLRGADVHRVVKWTRLPSLGGW